MNSRTRLAIMAPVLCASAWLAFFGDKHPNEVIAPVERSDQAPGDDTEQIASDGIMRLHSRDKMMSASHPAGLFAAESAKVGSVDVPSGEEASAPAPAPVPYAFIGKMQDKGQWTVFLEHEGQTLALRKGGQAEGVRLDRVGDKEIELTELASMTKLHITTETQAVAAVKGEQ